MSLIAKGFWGMGGQIADFGVTGPNPEAVIRGQRLRDAINACGKTRQQVATECGIGLRTLNTYLAGSEMQIGVAICLAKATAVQPSWLIFGENVVEAVGNNLPDMPGNNLPDFMLLPLVDARAAAGDGMEVFSDRSRGHLAFSRAWLAQHVGRKEDNLALIEAVGDSMSPTINDGDTLMIDTSVKEARVDSIYILSTLNGLIVKRVQVGLGSTFHIISDNPAFRSVTLRATDRHEMRVVAEVVGHGRFGR